VAAQRVVLVILDGFRADQAFGAEWPHLSALGMAGTRFRAHRAIFPSATRASAASVATGCFPAKHGLHGNQMGLPAPGGYAVHDVGKPEFFETLRATTGRTLKVPTMAERLAGRGGSVVFGNASPGAALAHDPDGHGYVYHRAISQAPGRVPASDPLKITLSLEGDSAATARFCAEVLGERRPALAVLWLGNPDDTQHDSPLGSPKARAAAAHADALLGQVMAAVEQERARGDDVLLVAGSDHGHETVRGIIPVEREIIAAGFKRDAEDASLVVVPQGTGFMIYAADGAEARVAALADWLAGQSWCGRVYRERDLGQIGHAAGEGIRLAVGMARDDAPNPFGVPGHTFVATRFETTSRTLNHGAHGGFGAAETHPFLVIAGRGFAAGAERSAPTSLVDLAPSALAHLSIAAEGLDGRALQSLA